jgi:hypothetical protein
MRPGKAVLQTNKKKCCGEHCYQKKEKEGHSMDKHTAGKDTIELLRECNAGCKMAIDTMEQIRGYINDDRLMEMIQKRNEEHNKYEAESGKLLEKYGWDSKQQPKMAAAMAAITTDMKLLFNNSNSQIAKLLLRGCNMGIEALSGYLNDYTDADRESRALIERVIASEEKFARGLKEFI